MVNADVPDRTRPFEVIDETRLKPFLDKLAEDMRKHGRLALAGDRMFYRRLATFTSAQSQALMRNMELSRVRSAADKAWHKRDFDRLIALYTPVDNHLSPSEKARLAYAKKHRIL
jgi:hypothetical protein